MAPPHEPYQDRAECANPNPSPVPSTRPASAIGQVLESPELLRAILGFLEPGRYSHDDDDSDIAVRAVNKAALAACARVSRHFSQHALDVLWFSLDGNIEDLLRILPSIQLIEGETMITGDITSAEWAHFCTYTAPVKEISYNESCSLAIDPLIWTVLARKCQGESLFPRMRLLDAWLADGDNDVSALLCFLSPSLRVFDLRTPDPTDSSSTSALQLCARVKMLFQVLVDIAPNLTDLVWEVPCHRRFGTGFLARIGCLRNLRSLRLTQPVCLYPPKKTRRLRPSTQDPAAEITLLRALAEISPLRYLYLDVRLAELDREMIDEGR